MDRSIADRSGALERLNNAAPCGRSAKASLDPHVPACDLREPAKEALKRTAKQDAAAEAAGITQSRLSHKFGDGTLTIAQMEAFGPAFAAEYGRMLVEQYASLATPRARIKQKARDLRAIADEVDQVAELIA